MELITRLREVFEQQKATIVHRKRRPIFSIHSVGLGQRPWWSTYGQLQRVLYLPHRCMPRYVSTLPSLNAHWSHGRVRDRGMDSSFYLLYTTSLSLCRGLRDGRQASCQSVLLSVRLSVTSVAAANTPYAILRRAVLELT